MKNLKIAQAVAGGVLIVVGVGLLVAWTVLRVYVAPDEMLVLVRKTGSEMPAGQLIAEPGQKGVQREALGPGRYFFNPLVWDVERYPLVTIPTGDPTTWQEIYHEADADIALPKLHGSWPQVGVVTSLAGKPSPGGQQVVEPGYQGIQRAVLTPGTYRINPRAYKVELHPATVIPMGCCGVVISQLGEMPGLETVQQTSIGPDGQVIEAQPHVIQKLAVEGQRGVLAGVLAPGIYYLNPYVHKVKIVQVGYNEISQLRSQAENDTISFPARDGFTITVEVTVVWGRHPVHASEMINRFGDVDRLKALIVDQMRSICRNLGSDYDSTDFIRGEKREVYQKAVTETLRHAARQRDVEILIALIRNIEVHGGSGKEGESLKGTIQRGFIAREEELTRQKQRETAKIKADLATSLAQIDVAREEIHAQTRKRVAEINAEGAKKAREIDAQRELEVARIEQQIAELDAAKTRLVGSAEARVKELKNRAEADGKRMLIEAFGSGRAFNLYTFSQSFAPQDIRLIFAGEGTFWTDLSRMSEAAAAEILERGAAPPPAR